MDGSQNRKPRPVDKQRGDRQRHLTAGYDGENNNIDRAFREGSKSRRRNSSKGKQTKSYNLNQQPAELYKDSLQEYVGKKKVKRIKNNTRQNSIGKIKEGIVVKDFSKMLRGDKSSDESDRSSESVDDNGHQGRSRESPSIIERPLVRPSDIWKEERVKKNNRLELNPQTSKYYSRKSSRNGIPKGDSSDYSDSYDDDEFDSESDNQSDDDFSPRWPKNVTKRDFHVHELHVHGRNYPSDDEFIPRQSTNRQKMASGLSDMRRGRQNSSWQDDPYNGKGSRTQGQLLGDLKDALFDETTSRSLRNFDHRSVRDKRPRRTGRGGALRDSMSVDVALHSNRLDVYDYHDNQYMRIAKEMQPASPRSTRSFNVKKNKNRRQLLSDEDSYRGQRNRGRERVLERVSDERIARERDRLEREFMRESEYVNKGRDSDIIRERLSRQTRQTADHGCRRQTADRRRVDVRRGGGNKREDFGQEYLDDDELRDEKRRGQVSNRGNFEQKHMVDEEMRGDVKRGKGNKKREFSQAGMDDEEMIRTANRQPIEDDVWNSEYCDDPGMLDIPNLSPGYDDFCDILYDQSVADMKINKIKSDSMNVNLSSENGAGELSFEEYNGLPRADDDKRGQIEDKGEWNDDQTEFDSTDKMKEKTDFNEDLYYDQEALNINLPGQTFIESDEGRNISLPSNSKDRQQFKSSHSNAIRERMENKGGEKPEVKQTPIIVVSEMDSVTKKDRGDGERVLPWQQGKLNTGLVKDIEDDDHDDESMITTAEAIKNCSAVDENTDHQSYVRRLESGIWSDSNETLRRLNSADGQSKQKDKDQRTRELFLDMCRGGNGTGLKVPGTESGQIPRRKNAMTKTLSMFVESSNQGWHDNEVVDYCDAENRPPLGPKEAWRGNKAFSVDWAGTDVYQMHNQSPHSQTYFQPFQTDYDTPEVTVKVQRPRRLQNIIIVGNSTPKKERSKGRKNREKKSTDMNNNRNERGRKERSTSVRKHSTDEVKSTKGQKAKDKGSKDKVEIWKRSVKVDGSSKARKVSPTRKGSTGSEEKRSEMKESPKLRKKSISSKASRNEKGAAKDRKESTSSREKKRKESTSSKERSRKYSGSSNERNRKNSSSSRERTRRDSASSLEWSRKYSGSSNDQSIKNSTASKERKKSSEERKNLRDEMKSLGSTHKQDSPKRHAKKTETHSKSRQIEATNRKEILRTVTEGSQEQSIELPQESLNNLDIKMSESRGNGNSNFSTSSNNTSELISKNGTKEVVSDEERKKSLIGGLLRKKLDNKRKNETVRNRHDKQQQQNMQQHVQQQQQHQIQQQQQTENVTHQSETAAHKREEAGTTKKFVDDKGSRKSSSSKPRKDDTHVKKSSEGRTTEVRKDDHEVISDEETKTKLLSNLIRKRREAKSVMSAQGGGLRSVTSAKCAKSEMDTKVMKVTTVKKTGDTREEVVSDEENKTKILSNLIRKKKEAKIKAAKLEKSKAEKDHENVKKANEVKDTQKGTQEAVSDEEKKTSLLSNLIRRKKTKEQKQNEIELHKEKTEVRKTVTQKEEKTGKDARSEVSQKDGDKVDGKGKGKGKISPREGTTRDGKTITRDQTKLSPRENGNASPRQDGNGKATTEKEAEARVKAGAKGLERTKDKQNENIVDTIGKNPTNPAELNIVEKYADQNTTQKNEINLSKSALSVIAVQNANNSENNIEDFEKKKNLLGRLVKKKVEAKREAVEAKKVAEHKAKLEEDRQRALQKLRHRSYDSTDYESTDYDSSDYDSGEDQSEESETGSDSDEERLQDEFDRKKVVDDGSEYETDSGEESAETDSMAEDEGISEDGSISDDDIGDGRDEDLRKNKMPVNDSKEEDEFYSQGESSSGEEESNEEGETGSSEEAASSEEEEASSEDEIGSSEEGSFSGSGEEGSSSEEEERDGDETDHETDVESESESEDEEALEGK